MFSGWSKTKSKESQVETGETPSALFDEDKWYLSAICTISKSFRYAFLAGT
jgi:hypothetical protein